MSQKTTFEVILNKQSYIPGELVSGTLLVLASPYEPPVIDVSCKLSGTERTGNTVIDSSYEKEIFSLTQDLQTPQQLANALPANTSSAIELPFEFRLPKGIPPTLPNISESVSDNQTVSASITYTLMVSVRLFYEQPIDLDTLFSLNRIKFVDIIVVPPPVIPPTTIVPYTSVTETKLYACMGCCFQRGTMKVETIVDKNFYRGDRSVNFTYKINVGKSTTRREIKSIKVSIVRSLSVGTGYDGTLEYVRVLDYLTDITELKNFDSDTIKLEIDDSKNTREPWIIGTSLRCMYSVKLDIISRDYPDDPYTILTPLFFDYEVGQPPAANRMNVSAVRAVYQTLTADGRLTLLDPVTLVLPTQARPDVGFMKRSGTLSRDKIPKVQEL